MVVNELARIYCLVGKSCSGKDTIYERLLTEDKHLIPLVTYTTRPIRLHEVNGKEYYFVNDKTFHSMLKKGNVIEYREYDTVHGKWYYFTAKDGQIDISSRKKYITINTLSGAKKLIEQYGRNVVVIHLFVNDETRIFRMIGREINGEKDFAEMCRRFLADTEDFSMDKFKELNVPVNHIENINLVECTKTIKEIMRRIK